MLLAVLGVPGAAAWGEEGSVSLGASIATTKASSSNTGSVELGLTVNNRAADAEAPGGSPTGTVDIGIALAHAERLNVSLTGYYCDKDGNIDESRDPVLVWSGTAERGEVLSGDMLAGLADRGYEGDVKYWIDGWYAGDPAAEGAVSMGVTDYTVEGHTALYCLWKQGYSVRFDANNGSGEAAEKRAGKVEGSAYASVERNEAYDSGTSGAERPAGVAWKDVPEATRPGYRFCGWYWPASEGVGADGRAVLGALAVPAKGGEGYDPDTDPDKEVLTYDDVKGDGATRTLYAKWELDPGVCVLLEDAAYADGGDVHVWWWPGRGYALERPGDDFEVTGTLYGGYDEGVSIAWPEAVTRPQPASKLFKGWGVAGYEGVGLDGEKLDGTMLVSWRSAGGASGAAGAGTYRFERVAFDGNPWATRDAIDRLPDNDHDGWAEDALPVVGTPVAISVKAPFQVVFDNGGAAYSPAELAWDGTEAGRWLASSDQPFTNYTGRRVYVSGLECTDAGASALLPGGQKDPLIFSLYRAGGSPADDSALAFGYAEGADRASAAWRAGATDVDDDGKVDGGCLVLVGSEADAKTGAVTDLRFGLDLKAAAFDKSAMVVGNGADDQYTAGLANVKYTYALAPTD